jgi:hypothetical protein
VKKRLLDLVAPVRPPGGDRGYRRLLRWAALPVTDRRWAAPLSALALGFGLFAGVAIGPGVGGTLATGAPQVIEMPSLLGGEDGGGEEAEGEASPEGGGIAAGGGGGEAEAPPLEAGSSALEPSFPEAQTPPGGESEPTTAPAGEPEDEAEPEEEEEAQTLAGLVVHVNPAAGSYTVVETGGLMSAVHAVKLPAAGAKIAVPVRTLANGTFAEAGRRKQTGERTGAEIAGIVTFVDPAAPAYAVSKRGVSVLVQVRPDPTGAAPVLPQLGAYATVSVEIEKPPPAAAVVPPAVPPVTSEAVLPPPPTCTPAPAQPLPVPAPTEILWQAKLEADGAPFSSSDFEGLVTVVCPAEAKLAISADDLRQSGKDVLFTVPKSIKTGELKPGDSVAVTAAFEADGSLRLTGLASDEHSKGADDTAAAQGDLASHAPK